MLSKNTIYDIIFEIEKSCKTWLEEKYSKKEIYIHIRISNRKSYFYGKYVIDFGHLNFILQF